MRNLKFGFGLFLISLLIFLSQPVLAGDSATVVATIQSEIVAISVDKSSIDYGLVMYGTSKELPDVLTVTNSGNVNVDIQVSGTNATEKSDNTKVWNLSAAGNGNNQFYHGASLIGDPYIGLEKDLYKDFLRGVVPNGAASNVHMKTVAPFIGSLAGTFETNVYFRAVKAT